MDCQRLYSDIFKIDDRVRFAAAYDKSLTQLGGRMREGLESYLPESIIKLTVDQSFQRLETRLAIKDWIGLPKYAFAEYEKIKRFTFYFDDNKLLIVTTEPSVDSCFIIDSVLKLLQTICFNKNK